MKLNNQRVCIYPKDIQRITGKSYRQSTRLMQKIKKDLNKLENERRAVALMHAVEQRHDVAPGQVA